MAQLETAVLERKEIGNIDVIKNDNIPIEENITLPESIEKIDKEKSNKKTYSSRY